MTKRNLYQENELEAYLGENINDFDVEAIVDEATEIDYKTGDRYWKDDIDLAAICAAHDLTNPPKPDENSIYYDDWYAVDSYDPTDGKMTRVYVGDEATAYKLMRDYFSQPQELAMGKFYRCKLLSNEDVRAYFDGNTDIPDERGAYSVTEAAGMLGVSRQYVHQLIATGKLDACRFGKKAWSIYRYSLERYMEQHG